MKILVINIALRQYPARKYPPIGLGYIVTAINRAGFSFELLDLDNKSQLSEVTENYLTLNQFDVVIMGCLVTGYRHVKWLSTIIKSTYPDTKIIVGNTVGTSIPDIVLKNTSVDIIVMGEGDVTIVKLLNTIKKSGDLNDVQGICYLYDENVIKTQSRPAIDNIDTIPSPNWDLFDIESYIQSRSLNLNEPYPPIPREKIRNLPINTARGCPFNCSFCYQAFRDYKYRYRSPQSIIMEMEQYHNKYGINYFSFGDELTFSSLNQADKFADCLLESDLKVYWEGACRSGLFSKDEDIATAIKLKKSGCVSLSYSLESSDSKILKWMNKKITPESFSYQVQLLKSVGIPSLTSLVFGYPIETKETIQNTINLCIKNEIYPSAGYLLPLPGSKMYDYAKENGYIPDEEAYLLKIGDRQDLHLNLTSMSDDEFTSCVNQELARCAQELRIPLEGESLLKSGHYRSKSK